MNIKEELEPKDDNSEQLETIFIEEALHRLVEINYQLGLIKESEKFAKVLGYNYWKPVQAGHPTDISFVSQFLPNEAIIEELSLIHI